MAEKLYGVKDVIEITGLDRNRIYYWSKTLSVVKPDYMVPGRHLYKLRALLDFRLIAELLKMGIGPSRIESIVWPTRDVDVDGIGTAILPDQQFWDIFIEDRWKYENEGFFFICREKRSKYATFDEYFAATSKQVEPIVWHEAGQMPPPLTTSAILINLLYIIHEVEEKTGEKLE